MDTNNTSGQPRLLNLEELAAVIRKMREVFQWSQETLAELAGLNVRTVQRVENAKSASIDTRRALARAFDIEDIDTFNKPFVIPTEEEMKQEKARHHSACTAVVHGVPARATRRKLHYGYLSAWLRDESRGP